MPFLDFVFIYNSFLNNIHVVIIVSCNNNYVSS